MSKEYTIFVLDASKSMDIASQENQNNTDLEICTEFVFDYLRRQLLKNRKSDRFGLILFSSNHIEELYENKPLSLETVRFYHSRVKSFHERDCNLGNGRNDVTDALKSALDQFDKNLHLKFIRNLFLLTNGELSLGNGSMNSDWQLYKDTIESAKIDITMGICDLDSNVNKSTSKEKVIHMLKRISKEWGYSKVRDLKQLTHTRPPLKLVGPRNACTGKLTFATHQEAFGPDPATDKAGIKIEIQVFPAVKSESLPSGHEYHVDTENETFTTIKRSTTYYIKSGNEDELEGEVGLPEQEESQTLKIEQYDTTPGFKYSPRDVIALQPELQTVATLLSNPGIDILGFIPDDNLPSAYLTDESFYVVPNSSYEGKNKILFNSMIVSLLEMKSIAIVRYVSSNDNEVKICAAFPQKAALGGNIGYTFLLTRLAMKEDEKIGNFPNLTQKKTEIKQEDEDEIRKEEPDRDASDELMEKFITSRKLQESSQFDPTILKNGKVGLTKSESVGAPLNEDTDLSSALLASNPVARKFNYYLQKIIIKSLEKDSLLKFVSEDQFIENHLSKDEETTIFNTRNVLDNQLLYTTDETDIDDIAVKLRNALMVQYKTQKKQVKQKAGQKFDYLMQPENPIDAEFDEFFDIEDVLGN
ncbi:YKU80 [[Candida] subhashii]|uniref:YKU80 n=1 Tax=[Candida] subhashii TaxID=561895 RepID=A0A8J5UIB0_9ASCO|nr:YKU80 [[Candida] subhashii]KAG7663483.1 YKU80 [[Candida] subhashii]